MAYKIPLFDLNFDKAEESAVLEVLRSKWISTGPKTEEFESKFASMLGVNNALALSNCTVALHLAMKLCGIKSGDEVLCPSLTFVATANSVRYVDAIPVFCDISGPENPTIDPSEIERKISAKTKAIIVMHYAGFPCDMTRILDIAGRHKLFVIEDACHGPMSEYNNRKLGTLGDIGCFSFFSNKNISTGEGGMIITKNDEIAARARLLRSHGMTTMSYQRAGGHSTSYDVVDLGYNYRMDDIRAAIGIVQLDKLNSDLLLRGEIRQEYISILKNQEEIIIPFMETRGKVSNYIFPVVLRKSNPQKRDKIRTLLAEKGIQTSVHYPAVHRFSIYEEYFQNLPATNHFSENTITLPMYGKLDIKDIRNISNSLIEAIGNA